MNKNPDLERQDRRVRKTRVAIRSALKRLLQAGVVEGITIKDIAAEADIGYTTFFRHFPTKEAALADFADSAAAELLSQTLPILNEADSRASCLVLCHHVDANRGVWEALLTGGGADYVRASLASGTLERSVEWPTIQSWMPAEKGTRLVTGLVIETLTWWLAFAPEISPEKVAEIMDRTFVANIVGAKE